MQELLAAQLELLVLVQPLLLEDAGSYHFNQVMLEFSLSLTWPAELELQELQTFLFFVLFGRVELLQRMLEIYMTISELDFRKSLQTPRYSC